jgi:uncharacterized protein YprB with RNaseH-like and TPR domain/Icc-related predicted phosphoesterase
LRIVAFSDYRVQDIDLLVRFIERASARPDIVIYSGDDVTRFAPYPDTYLLDLVSANKQGLIRDLKSSRRSSHTSVQAIGSNLWLFCTKGSPDAAVEKAKSKISVERSRLGYFDPLVEGECLIQSVSDGEYTTGVLQIAEEKRNLFEKLASLSNHGLCAIIGNDDYPSTSACIWGKQVYSIQDKPVVIDKYAIVGIEGAIRDPKDESIGIGYTLYTEASLSKRLERLKKSFGDKNLIIVSHCPPRRILDLALRFGMRNIGSRSLRSFIEKNDHKIPLVICGHVHLQGGKHVKFGRTTVVNAASHDNRGQPGRVAIIDLDERSGKVHVNWEELYELDGIYGIGPATSTKFKAAGIDTVEKILQVGPEGLVRLVGCTPRSAYNFYIRAKATHEKRVIPLRKMEPVDENTVFLDIETDLSQSLVWLIGIYFKKTGVFSQFVADNPKQERRILREFLARLTGHEGTVYTFSGKGFDERVLKSRMEEYKMDHSGLPEFVDVYHDIQSSIAFPMKSYSLKSIANYFGYEYRHPELDGMSVAIEYLSNYQQWKDKGLLKRLLEYNEDDVRSLPWILDKISSMVGTLEITTDTTTTEIRLSCGGCGREYTQEEYIVTRFCTVCGAHHGVVP